MPSLEHIGRRIRRPQEVDTVVVLLGAAGCIALAFLTYWPSIDDYFVWDDFFFLRAVRNHGFFEVMRRAFSSPTWQPFDEPTLFWRPLIDVYFYAAKPAGIHPEPFHIVNIVLHAIAGSLAALFVWRFARHALAGVTVGLLFVIAPTYDYAVTWIAQISEILGGVLILLALLSHLTFLTTSTTRWRYAMLTGVVSALALLTKESTVILAVLLPALTLAVSPHQRRRDRGEMILALATPLLLCGGFIIAMQIRQLNELDGFYSLGWHMVPNVWRYLQWMVLPFERNSLEHVRELLAGLFLASGFLAILFRQRMLAFLFIWTLTALLPFTGFGNWIELRYTYLSTLPFVAYVVLAVALAVRRLPPHIVPTVSWGLALIFLAALIVTPIRTRDQQAFLAREAAAYEQAVRSVLYLCGSMEPGSHVFIMGAPYVDLWGHHTPAALNLYYNRVYAAAVSELPELIGYVENKCIIEYQPESAVYVRFE